MKIVELKDTTGNISSAALDLIDELRRAPVVVFAGSAVSRWKPSGLIDGMSVTRALWDTIFEDLHGSLEERTFIKSLEDKFPFEHLFELCPSKNKARDLLIELYDRSTANPIHDLIAAAFHAGGISQIITTNYDTCFEAAFAKQPSFRFEKVIDEQSSAQLDLNVRQKVYFKIHGSAESDSESLIFTLQHEGLLPPGKRKLLNHLLQDKICLFVGYSGLDFDLCPLIANIPMRKVIWNGFSSEPHTANSRNLLKQTGGTYVQGDMRDLMPAWLGVTGEIEDGLTDVTRDRISTAFTEDEIRMWRIAVLNSLGLPKLILNEVGGGKEDCVHEARAHFYQGKYLIAASEYLAISCDRRNENEPRKASEMLLDACDSFRAAGCYGRAWKYLFKARFASTDHDRGKYLLKKSLLIQNFVEILALARLRPAKYVFTLWLTRTLDQCVRDCLTKGNLLDFQQVGFLAQRWTVDLTKLVREGFYLPTQSHEGYRHLGYYHAEVMAFTEECKQQDFSGLTNREMQKIEEKIETHIKHCEMTEQNASLWKLLAAKMRFMKITKRSFEDADKMEAHFATCEYTGLQKWAFRKNFGLDVK